MQLVSFERRESESAAERPDAARRSASLGFESLDATRPGTRRLGAVLLAGRHAGSIVDLNRGLAIRLAGEDVGAPEAEADSLLPSDMHAFLRRGPAALVAARAALEFVADAVERYDAPDLLRGRRGRAAPARASLRSRPAPAQDRRRRAQLPRARPRARRRGAALRARALPQGALRGDRARRRDPAAGGDLARRLGGRAGGRDRLARARRLRAGRARLRGRLHRRQRRLGPGFPGRARPALHREVLRQLRAAGPGAGHRRRDPRSAGSRDPDAGLGRADAIRAHQGDDLRGRRDHRLRLAADDARAGRRAAHGNAGGSRRFAHAAALAARRRRRRGGDRAGGAAAKLRARFGRCSGSSAGCRRRARRASVPASS